MNYLFTIEICAGLLRRNASISPSSDAHPHPVHCSTFSFPSDSPPNKLIYLVFIAFIYCHFLLLKCQHGPLFHSDRSQVPESILLHSRYSVNIY